MEYRAIIQGMIDFGSKRSFDMVKEHFLQKVEVLYKREILFKDESFFDEETHSLNLGRLVQMTTPKIWKNTLSGLKYCAQFGMCGEINCWFIDNGKIKEFAHIEPQGDKSSITLYKEGKKLSDEIGREQEAIEVLNSSIEKYEKHSRAYEKRGYVNFRLENYDDAIYDFTKSLKFDDFNASSYFGRGKSHEILERFDLALADYTDTVKKSIALQPLHWVGRRCKGQMHLQLGQYNEAIREFNFFVKRDFTNDESNRNKLYVVYYYLGLAYFEQGKYPLALESLNESLKHTPSEQVEQMAKTLMQRGITLKHTGNPNFIYDIKEASALGMESAREYLKEHA